MIEHLNMIADRASSLAVSNAVPSIKTKVKAETEEEARKRRDKINETARKRYHKDVEKSRRQCRERHARRRNGMTKAQRQMEYRRRNGNTRRRMEKIKAEDPERYAQLKAIEKAKKHEYYERRKAGRTKEEADMERERKRISAQRNRIIRNATMSEEDKKKRKDDARNRLHERLAQMTPEELEAYKVRRAEISRKSYEKNKSLKKYDKMYKVA